MNSTNKTFKTRETTRVFRREMNSARCTGASTASYTAVGLRITKLPKRLQFRVILKVYVKTDQVAKILFLIELFNELKTT